MKVSETPSLSNNTRDYHVYVYQKETVQLRTSMLFSSMSFPLFQNPKYFYCGKLKPLHNLGKYPLVAVKQGADDSEPKYTVLVNLTINFPSEEARNFALESAGLLEMLYCEEYILLPIEMIEDHEDKK